MTFAAEQLLPFSLFFRIMNVLYLPTRIERQPKYIQIYILLYGILHWYITLTPWARKQFWYCSYCISRLAAEFNVLKMGLILAVSFRFHWPLNCKLEREQQLLSKSRHFVMDATRCKLMPAFDRTYRALKSRSALVVRRLRVCWQYKMWVWIVQSWSFWLKVVLHLLHTWFRQQPMSYHQ